MPLAPRLGRTGGKGSLVVGRVVVIVTRDVPLHPVIVSLRAAAPEDRHELAVVALAPRFAGGKGQGDRSLCRRKAFDPGLGTGARLFEAAEWNGDREHPRDRRWSTGARSIGATTDQPTGSPSERRPPSTTNTRETLDSRARTRAQGFQVCSKGCEDPPSDLRRRLELTWGAVNWFVGSSAVAFLANVFGTNSPETRRPNT